MIRLPEEAKQVKNVLDKLGEAKGKTVELNIKFELIKWSWFYSDYWPNKKKTKHQRIIGEIEYCEPRRSDGYCLKFRSILFLGHERNSKELYDMARERIKKGLDVPGYVSNALYSGIVPENIIGEPICY